MGTPDWRVASDYEPLKALDTHDLAAEFLRRNPDFQRDQERLTRLSAADRLTPEEAEAFALRWGVRFRTARRSFLVDAAELAGRARRRICPSARSRSRS
jgi:hypothetical protein